MVASVPNELEYVRRPGLPFLDNHALLWLPIVLTLKYTCSTEA